jgi:molecular chaperone GrpE
MCQKVLFDNLIQFKSMKKEKNQNDNIENEEVLQETHEAEMQEINELELDADTLEQKIADLNEKNLRLMAEFDNYRKRTMKERSELIKTAGEDIFKNLLPLMDDFDRAMEAMETAQNVDAVKQGVQLIHDKFIAFLLRNGVKEIPTENEPFDVDLHEAVTTFPAASDDMKGKIMDCISKGYTLNDKVIRYPKVVVCE